MDKKPIIIQVNVIIIEIKKKNRFNQAKIVVFCQPKYMINSTKNILAKTWLMLINIKI